MSLNYRKFYESMERFSSHNMDDRYSACNWQIYKDGRCIEHRFDSLTQSAVIVQYYPDGKGYTIYSSHNTQ